MPTMIDAENPDHIPATLDGCELLHISVLADEAGEAFDVESGNAPASTVAAVVAARSARDEWSVVYTDEANHNAVTAALLAHGQRWRPADEWPGAGPYLWAADPTGVEHATVPWSGVTPLAVQWEWAPDVNTSSTAPGFPAAVAGYIDGAESTWPADQLARFTTIVPPDPHPAPDPAPHHPGGPEMFLVVANESSPSGVVQKDTQWVLSTTRLQVVEPNNEEWSKLLGQVPTPVSGAFIESVPLG